MADDELNKIKNDLIPKGSFDEALERLKSLSQRNPKNSDIMLVIKEVSGFIKDEDLILRYIERKNYKIACDRLRKLTKRASECARLRILKCECMIYTDKLGDAILSYPKIKDLGTGNDVKLLHSMMAFYKGDLGQAISICEDIKDSDKATDFLNHLKDLKTNFDLGESEEKQKNYKNAQVNYCRVVEMCDLKTNRFCLNKVLIVKGLVRRARVNVVLHAHVDVMADSHRAVELLEKIKYDKINVDRKLMAYLSAHAYIGLANGHVKLMATSFPSHFDMAMDQCQDYKDLQQEVLDAISEFEGIHKILYVGSAKYQTLLESVFPNESLVKHCYEEVKTGDKLVEPILIKLTRLPSSDREEIERVSNYIVKRFDIAKFEKQTELANMAKEILDLFGSKSAKSETTQSTNSLSDLYEKLKNMKLEERVSYLQIKIPNSANDDVRKNKLRNYGGKMYHPDHFSDPVEKSAAEQLYELLTNSGT